MQLFKDTHLVKLELLSNATTIDSALNYIRSKQSRHQEKKHVAIDSTDDTDDNDDINDDSDGGDSSQLSEAAGRQTVF